MPKQKILREHQLTVKYSKEDWDILDSKRSNAISILEMFVKEGLEPHVYGSIARGNTHVNSDIDIIFTRMVPFFKIELILKKNGYDHYFREILMATPKDSIKLYIHLSELESITVPITRLRANIYEFYDFGGKINYAQLKKNVRVPGIDKRLILIEPREYGHIEWSVINNEHAAAKMVGVDIKTINERKKVLLKREKHGKTGVFLKREIGFDETVEEVLKELANRKTIIRKKLTEG